MRRGRADPSLDRPRGEPFRSAEQAWFWTMAALAARRDGSCSGGRGTPRPCDPDDVVKCLDTLYRRRRIDLRHARILRIWGERQAAPSPAYAAERCDWRIWREALDRLDWPLRMKGIVA
ncbi:MAG: hypothetical protein KGJ41_00920 [Rhodospirillales bacterium]|nr:hypothetical protein [Rhodospirillales bacterium]MDE2573990.1 hypothetical protein [Rhodospirillales bacterium]